MTEPFVAEILRATRSLRSGDPAGATGIIQAALSAAGLPAADAAPPWQPAPGTAAPRPRAAPNRRNRRPLGEVVDALAYGRRHFGLAPPGLDARAPVPEPPLPAGAAFHDRRFVCDAGARRYRLYVPSSAAEGIEGLVVMLHGCTQTPEDFATGTGMNALAERHRLLVAYPAQTSGDNALSCWNWFRPGDQLRDAGEPAIIAGLTRSLRDEHAVPCDRVFVAGLSAGGAMAAVMAATYPELYTAAGVHSGLAYGSASDVASAFAAMRGPQVAAPRTARGGTQPRMVVFHGSADATVHPDNAARIVAGHGGDTASGTRDTVPASNGTRGYSRTVVRRGDGSHDLECWIVEGAAHAWSGGQPGGSYTDPAGPDASAAMVGFFLYGASDRDGPGDTSPC